MILDRHWWHNADKTRLVPDGDEAAAYLAFPKGMELPDATCAQLGIVPLDGPPPVDPAAEREQLRARVAELEAELERVRGDREDADPEPKAAKAPANKARAKSADKAEE